MASNLHIHQPYVLKTLAHPLDRAEGPGRHFVGEVFGQKLDSRKRKRSELAVAVDGDSVHLYDVPSQQAVTSYLVSPQSFFTCAPYSLRWRSSTTRSASRFTYISIQDSLSSKKELKMFKDVQTDSEIATNVTTASHIHRCDAPVVHLSTTSSKSSPSLGGQDVPSHDIVAVTTDGTILSLDGETMAKQWESPSSVFSQELPSALKANFQVTFVQSTSAADLIDGMFGGKNELFGVFSETIHRDGFNPDILVAVTSPKDFLKSQLRHLHVLALTAQTGAEQTRKQNVISVLVAPLPAGIDATKIQLDVKSGTLQELSKGVLYSYSFSSGIPCLDTKLDVAGMTSFLRLSKTSVLAATPTSISIYNPVYRSLQASTLIESAEDQNDTPCELLTYLATREVAVGLRGRSLVAVQIEAPKSRSNKRRAEGLLTDAIRRGLSHEALCEKRPRKENAKAAVLSGALPGTMSEEYWAQWHQSVAKADKYLQNNDYPAFEKFMAAKFRVGIKDNHPKTNGVKAEESVTNNLPEWKWPSSRAGYQKVDRRWVFYAISKVFAWTEPDSDPEASHLTCSLPESNVLNYLVDAGHLSMSNIKSAFKDEINELEEADNILGEELPCLLVQTDPTLELLVSYLSGTQLGPVELVSAIKLILRSLDLLEDPSKFQELRTKETSGQEQKEEDKDQVAMELERAEQELEITEYYLGTDSSKRAGGLTIAFSKLASCPTLTTVQSLRRLLKPEEVMCLVSILRMELIKDGWTTRYLDQKDEEEEGDAAPPPDSSIRIIADLLCRCIDSIGLGGWMSFDTMVANWGNPQDSMDFFGQFQAEVSVALEGIWEAVFMQGMLAEAVSYAKRAKKTINKNKTMVQQIVAPVAGPLPFGLKTDTKPSAERVRSGGEVVQRSKRELGLFASRKRRSYAVHRISEDSLLQRRGHITVVEEEEEAA